MTDRPASLGEIVHGTAVAVAVDTDGPLAGVLLRGTPGSGKSDLAMRMVTACPWRRTRLVADDAPVVSEEGGWLMLRCPETIAAKIELRGVGVLATSFVPGVKLRLVVDLAESVPRMPERASVHLAGASGIQVPLMPLVPFEISAPDKLRMALRALLARHFDAVRQDGSLSVLKGHGGK